MFAKDLRYRLSYSTGANALEVTCTGKREEGARRSTYAFRTEAGERLLVTTVTLGKEERLALVKMRSHGIHATSSDGGEVWSPPTIRPNFELVWGCTTQGKNAA